MKYDRFENLPAYKAAMDLCVRTMILAEHDAFRGRGDLRDQIQRAALSVSNNIAEGFELGTTQQLITFLYQARGSAGEVRSMLVLMERLPWFADLKFEISNLKSIAEHVSRQLRGWADALQNSDIKGQRYLTDAVREQHAKRGRVEAFLAQLEAVRAEAVRARQEASPTQPPSPESPADAERQPARANADSGLLRRRSPGLPTAPAAHPARAAAG
jgi:four helix bundle protein